MAAIVEAFPSKDILGEAPVWDEAEQALFWVDIESRRLRRFHPSSSAMRQWNFPERLASLALREGNGLVCAFERGLAFFDPETAATDWIARPEAHLVGNRFNDGKCDRQGPFRAGTMDDRLRDPTGSI